MYCAKPNLPSSTWLPVETVTNDDDGDDDDNNDI